VANNYLLFSEELELRNKKEFEWVKKEIERLDAERDENDNPVLDFQYALEESKTRPKKYGLWMYTEEAGEPVKVGEFVQAYLKKFHPDDIFTLTWAATCSRPRLGQFGGGGMVVTAKQLYFTEAGCWVSNKVEEILRLKKAQEKRKEKDNGRSRKSK